MQYIIDIPEDAKYGILTCKVDRGYYTKDIDFAETERLTADYVNEHFGILQDDAYNAGFENGKKATWELVADASNAEYQKGLNDAWEWERNWHGQQSTEDMVRV